jgi:serine/threonine protein kinase
VHVGSVKGLGTRWLSSNPQANCRRVRMVAMDSIGRYRLIRRLGAGSFATVWLGHDDDLDVPVAVKVLADNWASNSDVRNRFLAEARIMRRIPDRRLVQVYDIGTLDDGRPYFVMDYVDGGSLNDLRQQGINPVRALRLCADACRALDVLHSNDIIHAMSLLETCCSAGPQTATPRY